MATITEQLRHHFGRADRRRGERYFQQHRVVSLERQPDGLLAVVRGTEPYDVRVSWRPHDGGRGVFLSCSCPRFADAERCKHLWATLLDAEGKGLLPASSDPTTGSGLELVLDTGSERGSDHSRRGPTWQRALSRVADTARSRGVPGPSYSQTGERDSILELRSDFESCFSRGDLLLQPYLRHKRKDGEPGKAQAFKASLERVEQLAASSDRELLTLLLQACRDPAEDERQSWIHWDRRTYGSFFVPPALFSTILPSLCASGAWYWRNEDGELSPIGSWDEQPWQFHLDITRDLDPSSVERSRSRPRIEMDGWHVAGRLVRDGEVRALDDALLLLNSGLVLWPGQLDRLRIQGSDFSWISELRRHGPIEVPEHEVEEWLRGFWRLPGEAPQGLPEEWLLEDRLVEPELLLDVRIEGYDRPERLRHQREAELGLSLLFGYPKGETKYRESSPMVDLKERVRWLPNHKAEAAAVKQLRELELPGRVAHSRSGYRLQAAPARRRPEMLRRLTDQLDDRWQIRIQGQRLRTAERPNFRLSSHIDWFELEGDFSFGEQKVEIPALLRALSPDTGLVELEDGSLGFVPSEWLRPLAAMSELADPTEKETLRFVPSQFLLLETLVTDRLEAELHFDQKTSKLRDSLHSFTGIEPQAEPRGFRGSLREYQQVGLGWLQFLRRLEIGGCLADDMGLGKTVQVLALLQDLRNKRGRRSSAAAVRRPTLVVAPKSVVPNWLLEAERFVPRIECLQYVGPGRKESLGRIPESDLVVTTYGTMRQDAALLAAIPFDTVVLDEAQAIKNARSQTAKAARSLDARHRLALTGTPVENHLGELGSIFEFLNPGILGSLPSLRALADPRRAGPEEVELAAKALRPLTLRRTKEEVLTELPSKLEQTLYCDLSARERQRYNQLLAFYRAGLEQRVEAIGLKRAKFHVLEALLRLRQAACHQALVDEELSDESSAKVDLLVEHLADIVQSEGHKALVFSQFVKLLQLVRARVEKRGWSYELLHGQTRNRQERIERFQQDPDCRLFLISLKAGGFGLNLTAADYVFILDPWWNPAVESQAVDRAHRIGQERPVFAYRIIARDTIEERIAELQESKRALADAILGNDKSLFEGLTRTDLKRLLED